MERRESIPSLCPSALTIWLVDLPAKEGPDNRFLGALIAETLSKSSGLPATWDDIATDHLVIAHESKEQRWWEAIVIARDGDMLTLKWRNFDHPTVVRCAAEANPSQRLSPAITARVVVCGPSISINPIP